MMMVTLTWIGYVGTDDQSYAKGALGWLSRFPYVGDTHWELRHPVVIPLAVSVAIFGHREISLGLPSAFFFLVLLSVNYYYLQRYFDSRFALLVSAFIATTPLFVVHATFAQTVVVETLALSLSFWLFYSATLSQYPAWPMFASGIAAGLGFLTRETAAALLLFYGMLFVGGYGMRRRYYWVMALGFLLLIGSEIAFFSAVTGDPFYRYHIDVNHNAHEALIRDPVPNTGEGVTVHGVENLNHQDTLNNQGNLDVGGTISQPIFALLFNQEFGLLFWALIPAAIWACRANTMGLGERRLLQLLTGVGMVWLVFISYSGLLAVVPRFYTVSLWTATILIAVWLRYHVWTNWPRGAIFLGASLVAANLLGIYVENKNPALAERALVDYVVQHEGTVVYTDPTTFRVASLLSQFKGVSVPPGGLFFFNKKSIEYCRLYGCSYHWKEYLPEDSWKVVMRIEPPRKLSGILLTSMGLDRIIPTTIFERLDRPNPGGILYRRPS
jgi:4-amino-4-deoxy-L-arabinose transferase-like glycosyltransferase